jgi:predicted dehydrogenase
VRIVLVGTGAIANLHARAYKHIGYSCREAGYQALAVVDAIYRSCRSGDQIVLG